MSELAIKSWGNSAGMRLPVALLQQLGVKVGDTLSAKVNNGVLELRKVVPKPTYKLEDLLAEMPDDIATLPEWDAMADMGKEKEI